MSEETGTINAFAQFVQHRAPHSVLRELVPQKPVAPSTQGMTKWEAAAVMIVWRINTAGPSLLQSKYYAKIAQYSSEKPPQLKIRHRRWFIRKPVRIGITAENSTILEKIAEALADDNTAIFAVRAASVGHPFLKVLINETFRIAITDENGAPSPTGVYKILAVIGTVGTMVGAVSLIL